MRSARIAIGLCCVFAAVRAQQAPIIRTESRTVLVEAVVTGKKGEYVRDLAPKDFRLWEDGKEQAITGVSLESKSAEPHVLVFFFDDTKVSQPDKVRARQAVFRFIDVNAAPNRLMAAVSFEGSLRITQNFTDNAGRLKDAITRVGTAPAATGPAVPTGSFDSRNMLTALTGLAESLRVLPGRKTVVLLTAGIPSSPEMKSAVAAVIEAASRSGVAIYPADVQPGPVYVAASGLNEIHSADTPATLPGLGTGPRPKDGDPSPVIQDPAASTQPLLQTLATGTGGFFTSDTSQLLAGLRQIGAEQTEYYVLSYTPPDSKEGSCHGLRVKVARAGANVRARSTYCADKPPDLFAGTAAAKELEDRAAGADAGNLTASIQLPYFHASPGVARVLLAMELAPQLLKFDDQKGKFHAEVNVLGIAAAPDGTPRARFSDVIKLDFDDPTALERFRQIPIHYEKEFKLIPGTYNVSLVFSSGGSFGKFETPLTVDVPPASELALSSVVLSRQTRPAADLGLFSSLVQDQTPLVAEGTQFVPTGSRQFTRNEEGFFYVELYAPDPASVSMQVRLLDRTTGESKWDSGAIRPPAPSGRRKTVVQAGASLRLKSLPVGSYRLEITASSASIKQVQSTSDFEVK